MSPIPGSSGAAVIRVSTAFGVEHLVLHNAQYEVELENLVQEATTPNGGGWTEGLPKLKTVRRVDVRWFDRFVEDQLIYPVLGLLQPGTDLDIFLRRGERPQWYAVYHTVVRRLVMRNTSRTARTWELVAEHGQFSSPTDIYASLEHLLGSDGGDPGD